MSLIPHLPAINASLNAVATVLLLGGFVMIRGGRREAHKRCMVSALTVSALFLIGYVAYRVFNPHHTKYGGTDVVRYIYYAILLTHVLLAISVPPLAFVAVRHALKARFDRHRAVVRYLYPIWLYVSVTGVVIYLMLRPYYPT